MHDENPSGAVRLGLGKKFDESAGRELNAGDFAVVPAGYPMSRGREVKPLCRFTAKDRSSANSSILRTIRRTRRSKLIHPLQKDKPSAFAPRC